MMIKNFGCWLLPFPRKARTVKSCVCNLIVGTCQFFAFVVQDVSDILVDVLCCAGIGGISIRTPIFLR